MTRTAVVLFNLGGPDRREAVAPFLFNLFNDRAIIALPQPLRWLAARVIAARRTRPAQAIYDRIGGGSPLRSNTEAQAAALERQLGPGHRVFVAMRHWHPMSREAARAVKAWRPDQVILLPLYPQFSTTTTGSSLKAWRAAARAVGLVAPTRALCCYPTEPGFVGAVAARLHAALAAQPEGWPVRVLFSAHGLPKLRIVDTGDPYQRQVEATVAAGARGAGASGARRRPLLSEPGRTARMDRSFDREAEIERGRSRRDRPRRGADLLRLRAFGDPGRASTLLYRERAAVSSGFRAIRGCRRWGPPLAFIAGLAGLVHQLGRGDAALEPGGGTRFCPASCGRCALAARPPVSFLAPAYPWIKAFHIVSVIAWMAGMLYLPRLYVYHAGTVPGSEASETFKVMERRLLHGIMNSAMAATYGLRRPAAGRRPVSSTGAWAGSTESCSWWRG